MKKFNWMLNAFTLVAMVLGLVMMPAAPASAEPSSPLAIIEKIPQFGDVNPNPCSANAAAYYRVDFYTDGRVETFNTVDLTFDLSLFSLSAASLVTESIAIAFVADTTPLHTLDAMTGTHPNSIEIVDNKVRITPGEHIVAHSNVKVEFFGPAVTDPDTGVYSSTIDPPEPAVTLDSGFVNPAVATYTNAITLTTSEAPEYLYFDVVICKRKPVQLYLKKQIPTENCGYTELEGPIGGGFDTIQAGLTAIKNIWDQSGPYAGKEVPRWNLFDDCPKDFIVPAGITLPPVNSGTFGGGVYVGAVVAVEADANDDGVKDIYDENLTITAPGVIVASEKNKTTLVERAIVDGWVQINAGGVTFGETKIVTGTDDFGGPAGYRYFYGFEVMNAGTVIARRDGIQVEPDCGTVKVYSSTAEGVYTVTATSSSVITLSSGTLNFEDKIVNLTNGWSAYVITTTASGGMTATLTLTQPVGTGDPLIDPSVYFDVGDVVAVFAPSALYDCDDARVDVCGNDVYSNTLSGIAAYSTAIWVDGNMVYDNDQDGFYGQGLQGCGAIKLCDGGGTERAASQLLEISNNHFYSNGDGAQADWLGDSDCFKPTVTIGDDAGIHISSTLKSTCAYTDTTSHLYINNNVIGDVHATVKTPNAHAGIWLDTNAAVAGIRILRNDITNNGVFGLSNEATTMIRNYTEVACTGWGLTKTMCADWVQPTTHDEVDVIFKYNNVYGNGGNLGEGSSTLGVGWGVKNWVVDTPGTQYYFNAKENFWNPTFDDAGPSAPSAPSGDKMYPGGPSKGPTACAHMNDQRSEAMGYGDAVNKGTFYNPWLGQKWATLTTLPDQGKRAYGSDSLELQKGWNTLAVPLPLHGNAQGLAQISDLGSFLTDDPADPGDVVEAAWAYDGGVWLDWGTSQWDIQAVHGYYIKLTRNTKFPVIYRTAFAPPASYDLVQGWNLIGSAFGIDRLSNTDDDQMRWAVADPDDALEIEATRKITEALVSIVPDQAGGGAAMIVSPGVPGQIGAPWSEPWWPLGAPDRTMYTGEGYWVYMKKAGVLGGFEVTPLFLDPAIPLR